MDNERKPYSAWWTLGTKTRIDPRIAKAAYGSAGVVMLFAVLYAFTGLESFLWLVYLSAAVLIVIVIGGLVVDSRSRLHYKSKEKPH